MINIETNMIKGYKDFEVPYKLYSKDKGAKKLAIILPGAGYTSQAPLLHFSTGLFIKKSYDVLQVNYQYTDKHFDDFSEVNKAIKLDVKNVIDIVLNNKTYDNFYLIGKSIGTIAMSSELNRDVFKDAKSIWLTPLIHRDDVLNAMVKSSNKGLSIIGDKDPCYSSDRLLKIKDNRNITSKLVPNVDHSLEYDEDILKSIDVLKSVIQEIEQF